METLEGVSAWMKEAAATDPNEIGAASVPYLRLVTLVLYTFMWARMVEAAQKGLASGSGDASFYDAKLKTAHFFLQRRLPELHALELEIKGGSDVLMALDAEQF